MNILKINSSSNKTNSISQIFGDKLLDKLKSLHPNANVKTRHTTYSNLPFVDETMLSGFFTQERTEEQKQALKVSQDLVEELFWADIIIISSPIYNFSVPASLKAYFDLIARAGLTFKYTNKGPIGLLEHKKAYLVMSSGGTAIGSDIDFAGKYVNHFLNFIGIFDVKTIKLDQLMIAGDEKQAIATKAIKTLTL